MYEEFDPEDPSLYEEDEDLEDNEPPVRRTWIRKVVGGLIALALLGNLIAFLPQMFSFDAMQFLKKDRQLSKNEQIEQYKQAIVVVNADDRKGTGFNIASDGLIMTNQHVVGNSKMSVISFPQGGIYAADVIVSDPSIDFAMLKIRDPKTDLPALELAAAASQWQAGDTIYVIGNPLFFNHIANVGTILGLTSLQNWEKPVLTLQAPIYKGNSGSPVINEEGKVIAIVFATTQITHNNEKQTVGLAIPIEYVQSYIQEGTATPSLDR